MWLFITLRGHGDIADRPVFTHLQLYKQSEFRRGGRLSVPLER